MAFRFLLFTVLLFIVPGKYISAQRFQSLRQAEDTLSAVVASLNKATDDSSKSAFNQVFLNDLADALKLPAADTYPFESLKTLVKIASPDNKFRIFHWNLPYGNGNNRYYGFIKMIGEEPPLVYPLNDISDSLPSPDTMFLDNMHWPGALYYKVIPVETASGQMAYTLLGWAGRNTAITQKVIEVLFFDDLKRPHFGYKLFPGYLGGNMTRIIFKFAATTTMSLKFEKIQMEAGKRWNSKKREFDYNKVDTRVIVFDRMGPLDPQLEGQFKFYVPSGDIFDCFAFQENHWIFKAGVDSRKKK
ncbi:MAG: hypothetical protein NT040_11435 [Bacteroidetes bacterium]|nr:hypothetical protein [Bacteroidota bacterium]